MSKKCDGNHWQECAPGLIKTCSDRALIEKRRKFLAVTGIGAIGLSGGFLGLMLLWNRPKHIGPTPNWITCAMLREHLADYIAGRIKDGELLASIEYHLGHCRSCLDVLRKSRSGFKAEFV